MLITDAIVYHDVLMQILLSEAKSRHPVNNRITVLFFPFLLLLAQDWKKGRENRQGETPR